MRGKTKSLAERFWKKVVKGEGPDACWEWTGARGSTGYGQIAVRGEDGKLRTRYAHRVSWELHFGAIPPGAGYHGTCVLHRCDNPPCIRPSHLFLGSHAENVADRDAKERHVPSPGEVHGCAKLDSYDALFIRALYANKDFSQRALAAQFGISQRQINRILNRVKWKHI